MGLHIAEPELAPVVAAPALDGAVIQERTCVNAADGERHRGPPRAEVHWRQCVTHLTRFISAVLPVAEPERAILVDAPALDGVVIEERARGVLTGGECLRGPPRAQVHRRQCVAQLARAISAVLPISEPELGPVVAAPALDGAVIQQRARVNSTRGERLRRPPRAEVHQRQRVTHLTRAISPVLHIAEPELARRVAPPALDRATLEERTGGASTKAKRRHPLSRAEADKRKAAAHLMIAEAAPTVFRILEPELTHAVRPPALDTSIREDGAGAVLPGEERRQGIVTHAHGD